MTPPAKPPPSGRKPRLHLPIAAVLVTGFASLMVLAVASVLVLGLVNAGRNTFTLLNDKADLALAGVEVRVRHQLDPARDEAAFVAGLIETGVLDPADHTRLIDTLRGALAGTPQITGIGYRAADGTVIRVARLDGTTLRPEVLPPKDPAAPPDPPGEVEPRKPYWADPIWSNEAGTTFLAYFHPVRRDGHELGEVVVALSLGDLSRFLTNLFVEQGINAFVLYDRDHVLAHPSLAALKVDLSRTAGQLPLPRVDQIDDPALVALWRQVERVEILPRNTQALTVRVGGQDMLFLLRPMTGYAGQTWTVGIALKASEVGVEVERLWSTGVLGGGILLVSVALALWAGRRISAPIARLAAAAEHIRALDFRAVPDLPDSRLLELSRAASAFNAMLAGLRWFETYVPKALVLRLMRRGGEAGVASQERAVTVMFTDIRGFTRMAEHLGAADTAELLNDHFTRLAECIEAEGGTVDKFIGDAIMAFWGAPEEQDDHAARALRAARSITLALAEDNRQRMARGLSPVRVRIGLHSGPVVVGNIGSANRINYTIVGDTVNVAARIEELASSLQGEAEVIVLVSDDTARQGADAVPLDSVGAHSLRGRSGTMDVWRLRVAAQAAEVG